MSDQTPTAGTPAVRTPKLPLNELRRADGQELAKPDREIPDEVLQHYHPDGNAYRSKYRPEKIEFVDRGHRMHAYRPVSTFTVRSLVMVAQARGWSSLELTGDAKFRSRTYIEAKSRGMEVSGYKPTAKDNEILQRRAERAEARKNPVVQAFVNSRDAESMTKAAEQHPALAQAFAARAAVEKTAAHIQSEKGRQNFVGAMEDRIALALHREERMPDIAVRDDSQKAIRGPSQGSEHER